MTGMSDVPTPCESKKEGPLLGSRLILSWELRVREQIIFSELLPLAVSHVDVNSGMECCSVSVVISCSPPSILGDPQTPGPPPGGSILTCLLSLRPSPGGFLQS